MIKVDVTRGGNPLYDRLLKDYGVKGVPTIVFIDMQGRERSDLRLVDFLPPDQFLSRMEELKRLKLPAAERSGNLHRKEYCLFLICSLTPPQAAGNALAFRFNPTGQIKQGGDNA
jgi:hypothetical protein